MRYARDSLKRPSRRIHLYWGGSETRAHHVTPAGLCPTERPTHAPMSTPSPPHSAAAGAGTASAVAPPRGLRVGCRGAPACGWPAPHRRRSAPSGAAAKLPKLPLGGRVGCGCGGGGTGRPEKRSSGAFWAPKTGPMAAFRPLHGSPPIPRRRALGAAPPGRA
eukprot:scaffold2090_cov225-Prasinococcus_capsulatus_cf.AAC.7